MRKRTTVGRWRNRGWRGAAMVVAGVVFVSEVGPVVLMDYLEERV
jgi:hypothetical protein